MNRDTALVTSAWLSLGDIARCGRVSVEWRAAFVVPALEIFTDYRGNILTARRHDYVLQINADGSVSLRADGAWSGGAKYNNTLFDVVPIKRFPVIIMSQHTFWCNVVNGLFGNFTPELPIFDWRHENVDGATMPGLVGHRVRTGPFGVSAAATTGERGYCHINYKK